MKNSRFFYRIFEVIDGYLCQSHQFATLTKAKVAFGQKPWSKRRGRIYRVKIDVIETRAKAPNWALPEGEKMAEAGLVDPRATDVLPEIYKLESELGWKSPAYWSKESAMLAFAGNNARGLRLVRKTFERVE